MSKIAVQLCVDNEMSFIIKPYEVKDVVFSIKKYINILLSPTENSKIKTDKFYIVLKTNYTCSNICEDKEFIITREKICFAYNAFYERLFLSDNDGNCLLKLIAVKDEENLKKCFSKTRKLKLLLYGPFETFLLEPVFYIIIGVVLAFIWGWRIAVVYFPCVYLFLVLFNWFTQTIVEHFFKKTCKFDIKRDFYEYLDTEYIMKYYSNPNRTPFVGKVEIN